MTINEAKQRVQKAVSAFPLLRQEVLQESAPSMAAANRKQLLAGITKEGKPISPQYSLFTVELKRKKGHPTDRVTLFDTGSFHQKLFAKPQKESVLFGSADPKTAKLVEKYGDNIFGLTDENAAAFRDKTATKIIIKIREITGFK